MAQDRPSRVVRDLLGSANRYFESLSRNGVLLISLILALVIGALDYKGSAGVLIVYLVPIALAAWYGSRKVGMVITIYCSLAWFIQVTYVNANGALDLSQIVNFVARLLTLMVLVEVISRLRTAVRLQRELIEFIIHDLRSPVSSAISGLMTLKESAYGLSPEDRELVDLALVSDQRALELVNSMLDVAKLESGNMQIERVRVVMDEFLVSCVEPVELWANSSRVAIEPRAEVEAAFFDPMLIRRVIVNLISNAIKFSPPDSKILIRAWATPDKTLRFSVTDHGPGIPSEYVSAIFEPFTQVKGTKGGTGLGLTFCRLAVNAHGGRIWAESKLGHGATMQVALAQAADPAIAASFESSGKH